jgi:S1-C subfamily serine protease
VIAVIAVVGVAAFVMKRDSSSTPSTDKASVTSIVDKAIDNAVKDIQSAPPHSEEVYNTILPSIVVIQSERTSATTGDTSGLGTGVIINKQGSILTALHVVDNATGLRVSFADGTESTATIASTDPDNDIAVLTADHGPEVIVPAVLGGGLRVGDEAFAVGHPLGLVGSLSAGVISGLDRSIPRDNGGTFKGLIQFDAAVNPGNSGGPLLNRNGQVVGIVTSLANPTKNGYFIGIGFAVPINTAGGAAGAPRQ